VVKKILSPRTWHTDHIKNCNFICNIFWYGEYWTKFRRKYFM